MNIKGWTGTNCQTYMDVCSSNPCLNLGSCQQLPSNGYKCTCAKGWSGLNCELNINECVVLSQPCQNNGLCRDGIGTYTCNCMPGFTGQYCEIVVDVCWSNPCLNNGQCQQTSNNCWSCVCPAGFTGQRFALPFSSPLPHPNTFLYNQLDLFVLDAKHRSTTVKVRRVHPTELACHSLTVIRAIAIR